MVKEVDQQDLDVQESGLPAEAQIAQELADARKDTREKISFEEKFKTALIAFITKHQQELQSLPVDGQLHFRVLDQRYTLNLVIDGEGKIIPNKYLIQLLTDSQLRSYSLVVELSGTSEETLECQMETYHILSSMVDKINLEATINLFSPILSPTSQP